MITQFYYRQVRVFKKCGYFYVQFLGLFVTAHSISPLTVIWEPNPVYQASFKEVKFIMNSDGTAVVK